MCFHAKIGPKFNSRVFLVLGYKGLRSMPLGLLVFGLRSSGSRSLRFLACGQRSLESRLLKVTSSPSPKITQLWALRAITPRPKITWIQPLWLPVLGLRLPESRPPPLLKLSISRFFGLLDIDLRAPRPRLKNS